MGFSDYLTETNTDSNVENKKLDKCSLSLYTNQVGCKSSWLWKFSSAGRASALQAEGHRFEPYNFHSGESGTYGEIAQLARARGSYPRCRGFKSLSRYAKAFRRKGFFVFQNLKQDGRQESVQLSAAGGRHEGRAEVTHSGGRKIRKGKR